MIRPEYIKCVARTCVDPVTWCGRAIVDYTFAGLDHAANSGALEDRHVVCEECLKAAIKALHNGYRKPVRVKLP